MAATQLHADPDGPEVHVAADRRRGRQDQTAPIIIVGAGLAGLCCARKLHRSGMPVRVLERADVVGGRVRTDVVDGFRLDRGFQVLLTAYPESQRVLDYGELRLRRFYPGALVRWEGRFHRVADPNRHPIDALRSIAAPVGSLADKLRVLRLQARLRQDTVEEIWEWPASRTIDALREAGFSNAMIDRFYRPFLGGIMFDRSLSTSSRMAAFVLRMFAEGPVAVPAMGMGEIPRQLAQELPPDGIGLSTGVRRIGASTDDGVSVQLEDGSHVTGRAVVIATEEHAAMRLIGEPPPPPARSATCFYFDAERAPVDQPILMLDGDGVGPVTNLVVMSNVAPEYAPEGRALISATVIDADAPESDDDGSDDPGASLEDRVRGQMADWFGRVVDGWRTIQRIDIPHAQPDQSVGRLDPAHRPVRTGRPDVYLCGDHVENASINGAMVAGRRAAEAVLDDLR